MLTVIFVLVALKSSIALLATLTLDRSDGSRSAGAMAISPKTTKAGGAFGLVSPGNVGGISLSDTPRQITAAIAAYTGLDIMLSPGTSYFTLPVGDLSGSKV